MILIDKRTQDFISEHEADDVRSLALRAKSYSHINFHFALKQIAGRQIAKQKLPSWYQNREIIYPQHLSLEQSSSEKTAMYKTGLLNGSKSCTLIDLTGGLGVDFSFMSRCVDKAVYVEKQPELVNIARHNSEALGLINTTIIEDDAENYLDKIDPIDNNIIYIDPARRNSDGKKTVFLEDCAPNLIDIDDLLTEKSIKTIIKLSPMLDISHAINSLKNISRIHIVSVNNETKELLLVKEKNSERQTIHCINILNNDTQETFVFSRAQENDTYIEYTETLLTYLYEPNSSIMKAGAYKSIASVFDLKKLHTNSHLYTSDKYCKDFPGRKFVVKDILSPNKKETKNLLKRLSQANISIRNYPMSVQEIRKQTKLKEGGENYIFATTLSNEKKVLILCEKADN